uniref:CARD domain-containing protein n=1 Tax=Branchiostoma floridae TaxID=7739 RepID=C3ZT52_BRAFL|eukprot:XP_002588247.1 hypothetical protein BRAFLDRAFT_86694 [Branchiostoma floridae]
MVRRIGPVLDYMLTRGALSLEECDRIGHELTYVSRFKELVATVNRAGYTCRRLLSASLKVFAESDMVHVIPSREEEKRILERGKKIPELPRTVFDRIITRHTTASVPIEVEIGGREMRVLYEQACKEGSYQVFYIRLILVGQHGNGKTSLKNSLLLLKFNEDEENTDGIVITPCLVTGKEEWKVTKGMKNHQLAHAAATEMKKMMAEKNKRKSTASKRADGDNRPKQSDRGHGDQDTKGSRSSSQRRLVSSPSLVEATDSKPKEQTEEYKGDTRIVLGTEPGPSLQQHPPSQHSHVRATDSRPKEQTDEYKLAASIVLGRDDFSNIVGSKEQPAMSIWDFAGHDVYYSSHHVFYSHYAIFILTLNLTKALTEPLEPWAGSCAEAFQLKTEGDLVDYHLESIRAHTRPLQTTASNPDQEDDAKRDGQPPVIVVGTNKDKLKHAQDEVKAFHCTVKEHFKGKAISKHVEEPYFAVDNTMRDPEDPELSDLREFILKVAQQQTHMGREIPIRWLELKSRLIEMEKGGRKYCSFQDVMDATDSSRLPEGFTPEKNVVTILRFFHLCGDILFFDTPALRNFVVLDPQWFVDVQKTVITIPKFRDREVKDKWEQLEATGLLEDSLIEHVWSSRKRQEELKCKLTAHKDELIKMMEQFDLVLQCSTGSEDEADTGEGSSNPMTTTYFVPSLLTTVKDRQRLYPTGTKCSKPIFVVFDGKFFPVSLYHRLVITCMRRYNKRNPLAYARCARFITSNQKQTFVITKKAHYLKMELVSSEKRESACFSHGPDIQKGLDEDLRESITKWMPGIKYKWCFQCCCQPHKDKHTKKESNDLDEDAFIPITSVTEWFADEEAVCETYSPATTNIDDIGLAHWFQKPKQCLELQSQVFEPATIRGDRLNPDDDVKAETTEDLIRDNYVRLSERLQVEKLIPQFIQKRLLDFADQQVIMSKVTTQSKAETLLQLLSEKGTCTPEVFVEILKKGDHRHVVDRLKRTSTQKPMGNIFF